MTAWAIPARRIAVPLRSRWWNHPQSADLGPGVSLGGKIASQSHIDSETTGTEAHAVARSWSEPAQEHASSPSGGLAFASDPPALENHCPEPSTPSGLQARGRPGLRWPS